MPLVLNGSGSITGFSAGGLILPDSTVTANALASDAVYLTAPAGAICFVCQSTAPNGWMKANGATVSRTAYAGLFSAIGTTFGAGDGSTTFKLPDLRGYFPRGWDDSAGVDSGRSFGTTQQDAFQGHFHGLSNFDAVWRNTGGSVLGGSGYSNAYNLSVTSPTSDGTNGTPRTAAETRPKNVALLACIKF